MLGVGFDPDGGEPRADWPAVAALAGIIARETAHLGLALGWLMNEMLGRFVIGPHVGNDGHRALLRMMAAGRKIVALAISEPQAGAHPKLLRCAARRHDGQWLLEGEKSFVSNGPAADVFVVLAVTGEDAGRKRFDAFIVDADTPGLVRRPTGRDAVLPPLGHCGLVLDGCLVPDARRLGTDGKAFDLIAKPLRTLEDTLLGSAMVGAMQAELEALARWQRGASPTPDTLRRLGALRLELMAIDTLVSQSSRQLARQGPGRTAGRSQRRPAHPAAALAGRFRSLCRPARRSRNAAARHRQRSAHRARHCARGRRSTPSEGRHRPGQYQGKP